MSEPWARSFKLLGRPSRDVLTTMLHLKLTTMSGAGVQALGGPCTDSLNAVLVELAGSGWLVSTPGRAWTVAEPARSWLTRQVEPPATDTALDHLSTFLLDELAARGGDVDDIHATEIVAVVRALAATRPAEAIAFARRIWRTLSTVPTVRCHAWWKDVADVSEDTAIEARLSAQFIDLLQDSGTALVHAGEGFRADREWRRALALTDHIGDSERSAELLLLIGRLRRTKRAFSGALTVYHELVGLRQETGDEPALAEALVELAVTMIEADRGAEARHYLERANSMMAPEIPTNLASMSTRHTTAHISLGKAWDVAQSPAKATLYYGYALAALIDVDDAAADEVRTLLAAATARRKAVAEHSGYRKQTRPRGGSSVG